MIYRYNCILISYGGHKKSVPLGESAEINFIFFVIQKDTLVGDMVHIQRGTVYFNFSILRSLKCPSYKWHVLQGGLLKY